MHRSWRVAVAALAISTLSLRAAAQADPDVGARIGGRTREGGSRRCRRAILAGLTALLRHPDTVEAVAWFRKAAAQGVRVRGIPDGSALRLRLRRGTGRSACARLVQEGSGTRQRRGRAIGRRLLLEGPRGDGGSRPRRRGGIGGPPTATTFGRSTSSGSMYFDGTGITRDYEAAYIVVHAGRRADAAHRQSETVDRDAEHRRRPDDAGASRRRSATR